MNADARLEDAKRQALLHGLIDGAHERLYLTSSTFHNSIDQLIAMLPSMVGGLAASAILADADIEQRGDAQWRNAQRVRASMWPDGHPPWADSYVAGRLIPEEPGFWATVVPLTFGRYRICVATPVNASVEHWCMDDNLAVVMEQWRAYTPDNPPTGWNRHLDRSGIYHWPDGHTSADP